MKCWMTRLRGRCACGCKFEAFALAPAEAQGRWIARTRSGFAALLCPDPALLAALGRHAAADAQGGGLAPALLARIAALVGDPAPDGHPYDTGLGPVCPRCAREPAELRVDRQLPEIVVALPPVTHTRWTAAGPVERHAAVAAALRMCQPEGAAPLPPPAAPHVPGQRT